MKKTRYFEYLLDLIPMSRECTAVCERLFQIPFAYDEQYETDRNRAEDGLSLRSLYFAETGCVSFMEDAPCTVLEMMIALSLRIERDIMGMPGNDHPERWFFEMLRNLGIFGLTSPKFIDTIVDTWMSRAYDPDGTGSLFPLKYYPGDQRELLIWDQMSFYLNENF